MYYENYSFAYYSNSNKSNFWICWISAAFLPSDYATQSLLRSAANLHSNGYQHSFIRPVF